MLKSLFFKRKAETDELLPPPPPFPSMELEEPQEAASEDKFGDLLRDLEKPDLEDGVKETKSKSKKLSKKELKKLAKIKAKEAKLRKREVKQISAPEEEMKTDLEELDIGDLKAEEKAEEEIKPKDIEETEDEIASAIEGIKKQGKKSFFSGLFKKNDVREQELIPEFEEDDLAAIKKMIGNARSALMNLDLEAAKNDYMEIMLAYNKLKPEDQAKVYHEIRDLYYERKNAEELKV